jgi:hypothetical protein
MTSSLRRVVSYTHPTLAYLATIAFLPVELAPRDRGRLQPGRIQQGAVP